jgi:GTP-binding protein
VDIHVAAGSGGNGCLSFRREKYVPRGGPDGGDGGNGGSVILEATPQIHTLFDFSHRRHNKAPHGVHGSGKKCHGAGGEDLVLKVPCGTLVYDDETNQLLADLVEPGSRLVAAQGGKGGRGNARFASPTDRAPRRADPGLPGEERMLRLELRILADVGIIGFPNAGKSTLLSRVSMAHPKVASYPFTTLEPHLGVVRGEDYTGFVAADMPGLLPGASQGVGLGTRFLRHIRRTRVLLHLVDLAPPGDRDPVADWKTIQGELEAYDPGVAAKPQVVVGNKLDLRGAREAATRLKRLCRGKKLAFYAVSAATGEGIEELVTDLFALLEKYPRREES